MFDEFLASLRCPACGAFVEEATIQTHIRGITADSSGVRVGFEFEPVDLTTDSILASGYALIHQPDEGGLIRLLNVWGCPECQTQQWARIEVSERRVHEICAVELTYSALESAHFICDTNAELLAKSLAPDTASAEAVATLRRSLPNR